MTSRLRILFVTVLFTCLAIGCAKKPPKTQPTPPPAAESVTPAPDPVAVGDTVEPGLPADIQELNAEVARRGLLGDVRFAFDESTLDAAARDRLARNADFLKSHPDLLVTIEGHCDERGTNEYNLALGDRRAASSRDYIVALGVDSARLRSVSYGEERPQCTASDEICWATNRRAHFLVTGRASGS